MERIAFLIESTNERLGCLLNPNHIIMRRVAGIKPRRSLSGSLTGTALTDDPLLYTGGGKTQIDLDLLFDVTIAGSTIQSDDVRDLTKPLWNLAENSSTGENLNKPPLIRLVWGKHWNVPGVVVAVAERLEFFTSAGAPQRSWLRMRLLRVVEPIPTEGISDELTAYEMPEQAESMSDELLQTYEVHGHERAENVAGDQLGHPGAWRWLADLNNLDNPLDIVPGSVLRLPPQTS